MIARPPTRRASRVASDAAGRSSIGRPPSAVDQPAVCGAACFHHGLRQRGVPVDDARELGVAALQRAHVDELLDQLGGTRADDVPAQQLAVFAVADDLDHAGALAIYDAAADRAVWHLS